MSGGCLQKCGIFTKKRGESLYLFMILLAGILWGVIGLFTRQLNGAGLASMDIVALRASVTASVTGLILLFRNRRAFRIRLKDLWIFAGTGIGSIVFFNTCYFKTVEEASLSVAAVLLYTAPVFVMLISAAVFREKLTVRKIAAALLTVAGCALVTGETGSGGISFMTLLTGLGAGLGYALYSIFGRFAIERAYSSMTITFYTFLVAAVFSLICVRPARLFSTAFSTLPLAAVSIGLGVICTVCPFVLYTVGLTHVENSVASVIASVEPVTATIAGAVVYGEKLTVTGIIGIVVVAAAMVLAEK